MWTFRERAGESAPSSGGGNRKDQDMNEYAMFREHTGFQGHRLQIIDL